MKPMSTEKKVVLGGALGVGILAAILWSKRTSAASPPPPPNAPLPPQPGTEAWSPIPAAANVTWTAADLSSGTLALVPGTRYRANVNLQVSGITITAGAIQNYLAGKGFSRILVYAPGNAPADWPNASPTDWAIDAVYGGTSTSSVPVRQSGGLLAWTVSGTLDAAWTEQVPTGAPPSVIVTMADTGTMKSFAAGTVIRLVLAPPTTGTGWMLFENAPVASILAIGSDQAGNTLIDLHLMHGAGSILGSLTDASGQVIAATFDLGVSVS